MNVSRGNVRRELNFRNTFRKVKSGGMDCVLIALELTPVIYKAPNHTSALNYINTH